MLKSLPNFLLIILIGFLTAFIVVLADWSAPTFTPPNCPSTEAGCNVLLNATGVTQTKTGGLILNSTSSIMGRLGIGTLNPEAPLDVRSFIQVKGPLAGNSSASGIDFKADDSLDYWHLAYRGDQNPQENKNLAFWFWNAASSTWINPLSLTPQGAIMSRNNQLTISSASGTGLTIIGNGTVDNCNSAYLDLWDSSDNRGWHITNRQAGCEGENDVLKFWFYNGITWTEIMKLSRFGFLNTPTVVTPQIQAGRLIDGTSGFYGPYMVSPSGVSVMGSILVANSFEAAGAVTFSGNRIRIPPSCNGMQDSNGVFPLGNPCPGATVYTCDANARGMIRMWHVNGNDDTSVWVCVRDNNNTFLPYPYRWRQLQFAN